MTWTKNAPLQYNDLDLVPGRPKKRRKESSSAELAKTGKKVLRDSDSTRSGKSRKSAPEVAKIRPVDQTTANEQIRVRRKEGYAAAEKRMFGRCALLPGCAPVAIGQLICKTGRSVERTVCDETRCCVSGRSCCVW